MRGRAASGNNSGHGEKPCEAYCGSLCHEIRGQCNAVHDEPDKTVGHSLDSRSAMFRFRHIARRDVVIDAKRNHREHQQPARGSRRSRRDVRRLPRKRRGDGGG